MRARSELRQRTMAELPQKPVDILVQVVIIGSVKVNRLEKGLVEMKSRIMSALAVVTAVAFVSLLLVSVVAYPMHIGEPSYYHTARIDCLFAACTCALSAILATIASEHF